MTCLDVGVRLVGLLQPAHVGSRPGHAVDADFGDAAALNFPDAGRDDERHRSLLAFRRKPDRRPEESARLRRRHATHRLLECDVLDAASQDDVVHGDPLLRQLVAQPGPGKGNRKTNLNTRAQLKVIFLILIQFLSKTLLTTSLISIVASSLATTLTKHSVY